MQQIRETPFKNVSDYGKSVYSLGKGAFGQVELYEDKHGSKYAVKTIENKKDGIAPSSLREISILTKLHHPNIVNVFDINLNIDNTIIIMEAAVSDFKNYLDKNSPSREEIMVFMYQLVKGLEYMHSQTVWHRDIKPQNLLVFSDGSIKYTDFGISRFGALPNNKYTDQIFTLFWRPPEILLGSKYYGPEVDIWALGIVFGEMARNKLVIYAKNEKGTLEKIVLRIGRMREQDWPGISGMKFFDHIKNINEQHPNGSIFSEQIIKDKLDDVGIDLLFKMLTPNPSRRISVYDIVNHPYFNSVKNDLDKKYNYQTVSPTVCGNTRVSEDSEPTRTVYGGEISDSMIEILFEWLNEVSAQYNLNAQTLLYARNIFDKYARNNKIVGSDLQLIGITSLLISGKIFEVFPPHTKDFVYITDNTYTQERMIEAEQEILTKLKLRLMFPNVHEFISYYNEGTAQSVIAGAEILGKILMIDATIPTQYSNHVIAETLVYIVAKGNKEFPKCLNPDKKDEYELLGGKIIESAKRVRTRFKDNWVSTLKGKERKVLEDIISNWEAPVEKVESPVMSKLPSPIKEGERMSVNIGITFTAIKDEDVTRENFFEFVNDYVMNRALNFANSNKKTRKQFADYFNFVVGPNGAYSLTKPQLDKISYELGKFMVKTNAKVNFNNVPKELENVFNIFLNYLVKPGKFSTLELFGNIHV